MERIDRVGTGRGKTDGVKADTVRSGTVRSAAAYSRETGRELGRALMGKLGQPPGACWLFCGPGQGMAAMLRGIVEAVGTENLVGCTGAAGVSSSGYSVQHAVLGGIVSDRIEFQVKHVTGISRDCEAAGRKLASLFSPEVAYIQLFSDGVTGNGCAILRGMDEMLDEDIPIVGGTAGDAGQFVQTWQFAGKSVLSDAAVAIGFSGDFRAGAGISSGWEPVGLPKQVTRSRGNVLYELNGEPALNVFKRFLGKHAENLPAVGVEYPLGFYCSQTDEAGDSHLMLRASMKANHEDGSITFAGDVPEGIMAFLTCGDRTTILDATEDALQKAMDGLDGARPVLAFLYSCMARQTLLGRRTGEEFRRINRKLGGKVPILGFYTFGEYCRIRTGGRCLFHNESAAVSIIGV